MGVSGCGKSTVAAELAKRLHGTYLDADDYHPASNIAKLRSGTPLTDEDRLPWLDAVGRAMREHGGKQPVVMACSALRRTYRQRILAEEPGVFFLLLSASRDVLEERLQRRRGHFMPPALLNSQLATLEPLGTSEHGATVDVSGASERVITQAMEAVRRG